VGAEGIGHAGTLERLEEAALERGGIARLVSSDADVAAHLDACAACAAERDAWLRVGDALTDALASGRERAIASDALPVDLSGRTLARVAAQGAPRRPPQGGPPVGARRGPMPATVARIRGRGGRMWLLATAAAIAVLLGATVVADIMHQRDQLAQERDQARQETHQIADLASTLDALLREPDHRLVALAATGTTVPEGTVVWGAQSGRLAVVTADLPQPPAGSEYRCWVERGGTRTAVGAMEFGAGLAYWAGWVDPASGIGPGSVFGVSLVPLAGGAGAASPPPAVLSASF
jgi:Anti-sigma-K factor rskA, C-terminal